MRRDTVSTTIRLAHGQRNLFAYSGIQCTPAKSAGEVQIRFQDGGRLRHGLHHIRRHAQFGFDAVQQLFAFSLA
jgi:hypothetical protein